jgi:hypothetical protein
LLNYTIPEYETHGCNWKGNLPNSSWGYAYVNGVRVLAEGLDVFRLGRIAIGGKMNPPGNLSFANRTLVGWMSASFTQRDEITLAEGLCDLEGYHFG